MRKERERGPLSLSLSLSFHSCNQWLQTSRMSVLRLRLSQLEGSSLAPGFNQSKSTAGCTEQLGTLPTLLTRHTQPSECPRRTNCIYCVCVCVFIYVYMCIYICVYICIFIYIYIYINKLVFRRTPKVKKIFEICKGFRAKNEIKN
jgi:hypothetical protein